jgi:hypothetical protein
VQEPQELPAAASAIGADQDLLTRAGRVDPRDGGQGLLGEGDVVGRGVRAGVPGTQQHRQGFTGAVWAVVGEGAQGVESEGLLERRRGGLLVRVGRDQRGVQVDDQRMRGRHLLVGGVPTGQGPHVRPCRGTSGGHSFLHGGHVAGQGRDRARDRGIRGHQAIQARLGADERHITAGVPTQDQRDRQIEQHLGRVMPGQRLTPRRQRRTQRPDQPGGGRGPGQQHTPRVRDRGHCRGVDSDKGDRDRYAYSPGKCPSNHADIGLDNRHPRSSRALFTSRHAHRREISGLARRFHG